MFSANTTQVSSAATYIEDVFSTYLYTGNGSTQTITNGIDLAGKGGLVWVKERSATGTWHNWRDTARGGNKEIYSNSFAAQGTAAAATTFLSTGFSIGADDINLNTKTYASWTFRKQPKFFDVVTFTQSGTSGWQTVNHNLGSVPGCIIFKNASTTSNWNVYHRYNATKKLILNSTSAEINETIVQNLTSTSFEVSITNIGNNNGDTFVAYLFAHDAGGFGLTGTDNVISCGSYTTDASAKATINLGYEPQWVLVKRSSGADNWYLMDTMRGFAYSNTALGLQANTSTAESSMSSGANGIYPTATGFQDNGVFAASSTFIYIAIRRGPMKTPTSGTSVFAPVTRTGTGATDSYTGLSFPPDLAIIKARAVAVDDFAGTRLQGVNYLITSSTLAERTNGVEVTSWNQTGVSYGISNVDESTNFNGRTYINWFMRRAPGFFDEVCYTGTGATQNVTHNLGVAPELMIVKCRSNGPENWPVMVTSLGSTGFINLNGSGAFNSANVYWNATAPTATQFTVSSDGGVGGSGRTYVAYLFASCPGVSKVGSYTGTGTTKQIDCGFTGGARFVLIKRTDSTGDWYVWDSARGIVAGNDPYLLLNSTAAEVTTTDYIDTYSAGFEISSTAPAAINANGGTFIFLAIA